MPIRVDVSFGEEQKARLPDIGPNDPPGSFTDGRDIILVSCDREDKGGLVIRQIGVVAVLLAGGRVRVVEGTGETEAVIPENGSHTLTVKNPKVGLVELTLSHFTKTGS